MGDHRSGPPRAGPLLRENLVRRHLDEHWPPPATELCLLHADYFPGNIVWQGEAIAAVIDWESAALGDPMADIATTRLDLRWAYGAELAERFTHRYLTMTGRSTATLPVWELVVSLRPAGAVSLWASDMAAHGRPDITADSMRTEQHAYVDSALQRLNVPPQISIPDAHKTEDHATDTHPPTHPPLGTETRPGQLKRGSNGIGHSSVGADPAFQGTRRRDYRSNFRTPSTDG